MDTPTDPLDELVVYVLKNETVVTSAQKTHAWERLKTGARQQVILPSQALPPHTSSARERFLQVIARFTSFILTEEDGYQRAATRREAQYRYQFINVAGSDYTAHLHSTMMLRFKIL